MPATELPDVPTIDPVADGPSPKKTKTDGAEDL